jgi:hypothetical protein
VPYICALPIRDPKSAIRLWIFLPGLLLSSVLVQERIGNIAASKAAYQQAVQEFTQALTKVGAEAELLMPQWDSLGSDPRFEKIVAGLNLKGGNQ